MRMPARFSAKKALMLPMSFFISMKLRRSLARTSSVSSRMSGSAANEMSARRQSIISIAATMESSNTPSRNRLTSTSE